MARIIRVSSLLMLAAVLLATGCAGPVSVIQRTRQSVISEQRGDALATETLSAQSAQLLRMRGLTNWPKEDPAAIVTALNAPADHPTIQLSQQFALTEYAVLRARATESKDPRQGLRWRLLGGAAAYDGMLLVQNFPWLAFDERSTKLGTYYAAHIAGTVSILQKLGWNVLPVKAAEPGNLELSLSARENTLAPTNFDELKISELLGVEGLPNRHRRYGMGLAMVGCRKVDPTEPLHEYYPRIGLCAPLSALLLFSDPKPGEFRHAELVFFDSIHQERLPLFGREVPLAADYTVPVASLLHRSAISSLVGFSRAFSSSAEEQDFGFTMVEPYDKTRIPLITVHGLLSSPLTWLSLHNDLMGDPVIRKYYQIWHYHYPTGLPILVNAEHFRESVDELYEKVRPTGNPLLSASVLIAHSMGGLLTRTIIAGDTDALARQIFIDDPAKLERDPEIGAEVTKLTKLECSPEIKRVVFVAVPHRGSTMAQSFIGWVGRKLISLPATVVTRITNLTDKLQGHVRPEVLSALKASDRTSIWALSPTNPVLVALSNVPIASDVTYHSIIGDRGLGDTPNSSDGVVLYKSSHLDGAASEVIVPIDHSAHTHPLAVAEMRRVLKLHLVQKGLLQESESKLTPQSERTAPGPARN